MELSRLDSRILRQNVIIRRQQRRSAGHPIAGRCCNGGFRRMGAGLALLVYVAAALVLPGMHLWRHSGDHEHLAGGIHYTAILHQADHGEHSAAVHVHVDDAAVSVADESLSEVRSFFVPLPRLRPAALLDSSAPFLGHAEGSLAHFARGYLAVFQGLPAPRELPDCKPAPRTTYQTPRRCCTLYGPLGARAPPLTLSS